jgi:SAM-dependent methyltransferase
MSDKRWNRGPWGYAQPWDVSALGATINDAEEQKRWSRTILLGGLPYIWRVAGAPMNTIMYSLLEVKAGDKVLIIGESLNPCGWPEDFRKMVGPAGEVREIELIEEARSAYDARVGRNGKRACWQWNYTRQIPDDTYDVVDVLQAVQHCDDWRETGAELLRILKPGRRLLLAEAFIFGAPFWQRMEADLHLVYWVKKLTQYFPPFDPKQTPYYSAEELHEALDHQLEQPEHIEWKGLELFWGRKPGN